MVLLEVGSDTHTLTRSDAVQLREQLTAALTRTHEFVHTSGKYRGDGSYVVERRGASSSGHRKVFDSFDELRHRFAELPETFTAEDIGSAGLTGGRRHMLLWHLLEHPEFQCSLVSRQPLTADKTVEGLESELEE